MVLTSPSSSLQKRLMITSVATLMVSMMVVMILIWFLTGSGTGPIEVTIATSSPPVDETIIAGDVEGSIRLGYDEYRWQLLRWGLIVLALMFLVAVVAAWLMNRHMFDRIGNITAVAQTMDEHHLGARFETSGKNDEIDHMATAINAALDRLQGGFERQRLFVRAASHELRTPLTVARTALEMPLVEGRVPEGLGQDIAQAIAAQRELEQLLDSLLQLSRGELGGEQAIRLDEVIRWKIVEVQQREDVPDIDWRLDLEAVTALVQPTAFETAIGNLVINAAMHNHQAGWGAIGLRADNDQIEITVENSGDVIDPDLLTRLCQPFVKRDASPGTGLGLAVTEQMIAAIGGELQITARVEGGLRVVVTLP